MALSAFDDRASPPDARALTATLGRSAALWRSIVERVGEAYGPITEEWSFAGASYGWSLRLKRASKAIVYLTPQRLGFLASFALGEKACAEAPAAGVSREVLALVDAAPRYAEGRGVRIPVRNKATVGDVLKLAALKMARRR